MTNQQRKLFAHSNCFRLLFIILLCVFAVCFFGVFVYAYVLFSVLWSQLPQLNCMTMMIAVSQD